VGLDVVFLAAGGALSVDIGALIVLVQRFDRDPVIAVVAGGICHEADVFGRGLAVVAPLLEEGVEALAHQRAGSVAGVLRDEEDIGRAFHVEEVRVAFGGEALLLQLGARAEG
jgi:hypothetical protein